jgi:hypothetical protein
MSNITLVRVRAISAISSISEYRQVGDSLRSLERKGQIVSI